MDRVPLSQRDRVYGPVAGSTVYLHDITYYNKLTVLVNNYSKSACIHRVLSWTRIAKHTLSIMLFSIFHKDIVKAIIKKQISGVICRIIMYRHVLEGPKKDKIRRYVAMMEKKGVQIRFVDADQMPEPSHRIFMIDYIDPRTNRVPLNNEAGFVVGQQPFTLPLIQCITNDMHELHASKEGPVRMSFWPERFESLWSSDNLEDLE